MQGVIFDIKRFAIHDGPGIRTSLFFKGCPLSCWWCHNPESCSSGIQQLDFEFKGSHTLGKKVSAKDLLQEVEKDRVFYDESGGGITFTGGEPLMQTDFLAETAKLFKKAELHLTLDTTGYSTLSRFKKAIEFMDLVLFDMKQMDETKHFEFTGVSNKPIFKNLEYLVESGKEVHVRYPMMPGLNDQDENIKEMAEYLLSLKKIKKIHLLPYHKIASGKYQRLGLENKMKDVLEPNENRVQEIKNRIEKFGFEVVIG